MEIVVTGIGLVSALGDRDQTWEAMLAGQTGIRVAHPFPELPPRPLAMVADQSADLNGLLKDAAIAALTDANLAPPLPDCGVVIGSSRSHQVQWETWGRMQHGQSEPVQPLPWLETLPHMPAIAAARWLGATGMVLAPMAACATGLWAIARGYELIRSGQCQRVLAGAVETPITPLTIAGFDRMGALASTGAYPFDRQRQGLVLGEGAALLVLETAELARQRQIQPYGRLLGFGLTADGYHVSAPELGGGAAIAAVQHCLNRSRLQPEAIDYIHAHGTATPLNDRNEAQLIQHVFPDSVRVSSSKGAIGHTIGASGALGAAFCLLALRQQRCPPNVGLTDPEFPLNLVRVGTSPSLLQHILCFSFGFGGQNAVLAMGTA